MKAIAVATQPMSIETSPTTTSSTDVEQEDDTEVIPNRERGCGYREDAKAYLRSEVSLNGTLPAFVEFEQPIPHKENRKRSYKRFPGVQFELSVTGDGGMTETKPNGEVREHINRLADAKPSKETAGEMISFTSQDLIMSVGKTYYESPEEFISEAKQNGVSKAISVTSGNQPPEIHAGKTRLFLIHPNAIDVDREIETTIGKKNDDDTILTIDGEVPSTEMRDLADDVCCTVKRTVQVQGIIGYTYLTRTIYTEDTDGNVPNYIQEYDTLDKLDVVKNGAKVPESQQGGIDTEAVINGLNDSTDEIKRFASTPALESPNIGDMEKVSLGKIVGETIIGEAPAVEQDRFKSHKGALAIVTIDNKHYKVMPSNNLSLEGEARPATTHLGPYKVEVTPLENGDREVSVTSTR